MATGNSPLSNTSTYLPLWVRNFSAPTPANFYGENIVPIPALRTGNLSHGASVLAISIFLNGHGSVKSHSCFSLQAACGNEGIEP
ncbi:hypothetical protein E2562_031442 [Oryza meyeriana var. granulata]|uniref:Uncharacterized protein n=1 Tax=Oryza meyeriana var. granulata TaxID=110450 RepID=A0A6G1C0Y0_9ORYZ|nr:hypothetical protein E2562_031442 [Oryza meyeriana var. granulata]